MHGTVRGTALPRVGAPSKGWNQGQGKAMHQRRSQAPPGLGHSWAGSADIEIDEVRSLLRPRCARSRCNSAFAGLLLQFGPEIEIVLRDLILAGDCLSAGIPEPAETGGIRKLHILF